VVVSQIKKSNTNLAFQDSDILFEDNHLIIVNKPCGVLVQGDKTGDVPLLEVIRKYIKNKYDSNFDLHIHDRLFNRFTHDNFFLERHGILGKFCQFLYKIKLNRLIFNFLKIPFPYMKLEIKNFLK